MTGWWTAAAYGLAVVTFVAEDVLRRLLMAHLKFWRIVCVDMSSFLVSLAILAVSAHNGPLTLSTFFLALGAGQFAALFLAAGLLPRRERFVVKPIRGGYGTVARYGAWRAAQQGLRPALLTGMRATVGLIVGLAATGQLEAARIYAAPTMLFVSGLSSFLFASFARDTAKPLPELLRSADRMVLLLVVATIAVGGVFIGVLPWLGHLVTGHALDIWLCVGWFAYSTSIAAVTPYGALAAVRHRQAAVFGWRLADSTFSLSLAVIALAMGGGVVLVPVALTAGSLLGGLAIRWFILRRPFPSRPEEIARTISPHHSQAEAHV
ncbi:hypothetical protein [Leifsonia sp. Root112D2]|uniref:hypothetical protein n=1 Tax=Leifsonia sp. Root112D2 TaxID=1736426 RepID=UPI000700268A|nr:hypothetical protein [Leifsonia sp. Root112D2]KQV07007.1 hypothetical protein ASC63_06590 [Leifsonia sp. Root112D2]